MMQLDETDAIIVKSLMNDARVSLSKIAKECNLSVTAIKKRVKKLEEEGMLGKAILTPNMFSFGYPYAVFVGIVANELGSRYHSLPSYRTIVPTLPTANTLEGELAHTATSG